MFILLATRFDQGSGQIMNNYVAFLDKYSLQGKYQVQNTICYVVSNSVSNAKKVIQNPT